MIQLKKKSEEFFSWLNFDSLSKAALKREKVT